MVDFFSTNDFAGFWIMKRVFVFHIDIPVLNLLKFKLFNFHIFLLVLLKFFNRFIISLLFLPQVLVSHLFPIPDSFDEIDVVANAFLIFVGAFESTSLTLTFCLYELALNQKIQDKLRDEVLQVRAKYDDKHCYESCQEMTYMDQVILGR